MKFEKYEQNNANKRFNTIIENLNFNVLGLTQENEQLNEKNIQFTD